MSGEFKVESNANKNLDIAFLGGLFPKEYVDEIVSNSKGIIQFAANALQWNIVEGLDKNNVRKIKIINSIYVGSYPLRYRKKRIKTFAFQHIQGADDINVGFCNFILLKEIFRYWSLKRYLREWANRPCETESERKVLIGYALTNLFVKCLAYTKRINPNIKTCLIVPDLPNYMNNDDSSFIYKAYKTFEKKQINKRIDSVDSFVLLTDDMKRELPPKPYTIVEGISTQRKGTNDISSNKPVGNEKIIFYSGVLYKKYGVANLLEAFKITENPNYRLVICGTGDYDLEVKRAQSKDGRIEYKGQISHDEVLRLQQTATVVVNPRQNIEEFTKYSFPSKNLEYLSSGSPLIAYKLDGIPDEYDQYIYYVEDNSIESLRDKLVEICNKPKEELEAFGLRAKNFVDKEKNSTVQCKKIIQMVEKLY